MCERVRAVSRTKYVIDLEEEVARLRAENWALLKFVAGRQDLGRWSLARD
jgi:hypothetical protein